MFLSFTSDITTVPSGSPYIVTELLHGESLCERLRHGPMRVREAIDAGIEIAQGLAAAHDTGIIHRDLKPENIFITKDGRVKILEFWAGKAATFQLCERRWSGQHSAADRPGKVLGTVGYMSPEQVRGLAAHARNRLSRILGGFHFSQRLLIVCP